MKYHFVALFTVAVWGLTFVSTKVLLQTASPLWILLLRFALGLLALCAIRPHILKLKEPKHEWLFIGAGATGVAAYYLLENVALVYATATAVGIIVAAAPLFTVILAGLLGDRSALNIHFLVGFALAMGGLVVVGVETAGANETFALGGEALLGEVLALLAALVWALYSVLIQRISDAGYETIASTKRTFLWGVFFIAIAVFIFDPHPPALSNMIQMQPLANLLFLGLVASAACFVTWGLAVKHLGPTTSTTYIYLVPAITATASTLILGEPLTPVIILGLAMTILGLFLSAHT